MTSGINFEEKHTKFSKTYKSLQENFNRINQKMIKIFAENFTKNLKKF